MQNNKPKIDYDLCLSCGTCIEVCPQKAIKFDDDNKPEINYDLCKKCDFCVSNCPVEAIKFSENKA